MEISLKLRVIFLLFGTGFIFTPAGHSWMKARVVDAYNETPEGDRRNSNLGDRFLWVAYFRGSITLDSDRAMDMYKEFCGYKFRGPSGDDYMLKFAIPNFFFHVTTTHDILRNQGVAVGKADYLGAYS